MPWDESFALFSCGFPFDAKVEIRVNEHKILYRHFPLTDSHEPHLQSQQIMSASNAIKSVATSSQIQRKSTLSRHVSAKCLNN